MLKFLQFSDEIIMWYILNAFLSSVPVSDCLLDSAYFIESALQFATT